MDAALFAGVAAAISAVAHVRRRRPAAPPQAAPARPAPQEIITEPDAYRAAVSAMLQGGPGSMVVILDFDRTITTCYFDEARTQRGATCHGIVESTRGAALLERARALNAKYYPLETDPDLPVEAKVPLMVEWYRAVHELLVEDGLRVEDVASSVAVAQLRLRPGAVEVFDWCARHAVPLLVFSAGLGDVLAEVLRQRLPGGLPPCAHVVSNGMVFDASGRLTGFTEPTLHMFNKNASALSPATLRALSDRPHVLLAGDSLGDATMAQGLPAVEHELRFGLLNDDVDRLLPQFSAVFDVVLTHDAPFTPLLRLLRAIAP